jgi:hypothetical protein
MASHNKRRAGSMLYIYVDEGTGTQYITTNTYFNIHIITMNLIYKYFKC